MPDSPVWPPPSYLSLSEGVIPLDNLRDFWWVSCRMAIGQATIWCKNIPEKLNAVSRVQCARTSQTTDGFAMPLAKHNVLTFG